MARPSSPTHRARRQALQGTGVGSDDERDAQPLAPAAAASRCSVLRAPPAGGTGQATHHEAEGEPGDDPGVERLERPHVEQSRPAHEKMNPTGPRSGPARGPRTTPTWQRPGAWPRPRPGPRPCRRAPSSRPPPAGASEGGGEGGAGADAGQGSPEVGDRQEVGAVGGQEDGAGRDTIHDIRQPEGEGLPAQQRDPSGHGVAARGHRSHVRRVVSVVGRLQQAGQGVDDGPSDLRALLQQLLERALAQPQQPATARPRSPSPPAARAPAPPARPRPPRARAPRGCGRRRARAPSRRPPRRASPRGRPAR